ncbi:histidine phosphatase superfamily [Microdochium trichocladiopsis]|uniref:Phytase A n=1 Tax=Microdochium trichocladiopsis TaxID=1682393 RepID=A0A9P9BN41_9PEZI|nr:histidine phosphatase superfamily [Microdochium trichocladiopsis]KAH7030871.1 histidine phosphatase superfamily [Microdochium trichocladiopsis]
MFKFPKSDGYQPLPENVTQDELDRRAREDADRHRKFLRLTFGACILFALGATLGYAISRSGKSEQHCETWQDGYTCAPEISRLWGQYSPFWPVESEISPDVPVGCEVTFAQVLSRHGARDPTLSRSVAYGALITRIHNQVSEYGANVTFLRDYKYKLGADELSTFGEEQLVNSGTRFYHRYRDLARKSTPFVRSADQHRVVESARFWAKGFHQSRKQDKQADSDNYPYNILEIPEYRPHNNTLSPDTCPAFELGSDLGHKAQEVFAGVFATPITARLNDNLPGANLSAADTISLMDLCPYETVADRYGRPSRICDIFSPQEWADYDYFQSLGKWYGYSSGNPLGPTQGVGFANELIARLTRQPVDDHTTTNSTLDSSPETFPLDQSLYADFSHDNDMAAMFGALGLYNATAPLDKYTRQDPRETTKGFAASWTVPFGARMYVEKMTCRADGDAASSAQARAEEEANELVRILVNDRVIPLQNCGADELGRCELDRFVESLSFARSGGHWDKCYL